MLTGLSLHYPGAKHTPDTLDEVARDMLADMARANVSAKDFREAVAEARRGSEFFPNVAQILTAHRRLCETSRPADGQLSLPHRTEPISQTMQRVFARSRELREKQGLLPFDAFKAAMAEVGPNAKRQTA